MRSLSTHATPPSSNRCHFAPSTIRRAKLLAVAILGTAAAVAVNAIPSIVFPLLLVYTLRELTVVTLFGLMLTHAVFTIAASLFGYLAIVALREAMMAALGVRWFSRVSPWVQGALIVMLGGSLLLLPAASDRIAQRGFDDWRAQSPPMWFLGAYRWPSVARSPICRAAGCAHDRRRTIGWRGWSIRNGAGSFRRWRGERG